jgi:UDP-N-acetylglucosamine 2-epimerase (non-hydrolysing)
MKNKPILLCFGTRPEWLKIKPLIKLMDRGEYKLLFTGQHTDLLKDVEVDYQINMSTTTNRLDSIISDCMLQFPNGNFRGVLVQGDTGSAFGCALAAFNRQLKIYYLEAGLRSGDLQHPYPEEGYRQMIARIADVNFAPTTLSAKNLITEGVHGGVYISGNSVLDNLVDFPKSTMENIILITLHRRENHHWMDRWFEEIEKLAVEYPHYTFVLPIHPNPNVQKHKHILKNVKVVEPMEHKELINTLIKSNLIISDSGGLQEEGSFFNKKVIVCRKTTERPEGIETGHLHLCNSPEDLSELFGKLIENPYISRKCPYGDGYTSEKVLKILRDEKL